MSKQRIILVIFLCILATLSLADDAESSIDRIETEGGAVLTGIILDSSNEVIRLETAYAGVLEVRTSMVKKIISNKELSGALPAAVVVIPADKPVVAAKPPEKTPPPDSKPAVAAKPPAPKAVPAKKYGWEIEAGMNLTGNEGNSEKTDVGLNIDTTYLQKYYRFDLYGRYNYGTNQDKLTSDELILGGRYTNFFYKRFGWFVREELERDKFEAIDFRTTTASGFSYKIVNDKSLDLEASTGLSYRLELASDDEQEDFPGMDFGVAVQWQFAPILTFKGDYSFVPSFNDSDEYIITQNSGFDIPISKNSSWKLRLGLTTKYNNQPPKKRERLDHKYYLRLIATWK